MKIPAKGQFKFAVLDMPESAKVELLKNDSTSYVGCPVGESINLGGNTYPFVVGKFKMTPQHEFEQVGDDVVLCETEAEMKESVQLLSEMTREVMVAMQCGNIGLVAFVQPGGRCIIPGFNVGQKTLPDGKKVWVVAELEMDKATGAKTLKRKKKMDDEQEARRIYQQWIKESDQDKKNHFDSLAKSQIPPVPANPFRCDTLTPVDIDDTAKARMAVLRPGSGRTVLKSSTTEMPVATSPLTNAAKRMFWTGRSRERILWLLKTKFQPTQTWNFGML